MIFRNGQDWKDANNNPLYDVHLKKMCGEGKVEKLVRTAKFELTERYSGLKEMGNGREPVSLKMSSAKAVGIPVEYTWTDDNGHNVLIRYVTHTEQKKEGNSVITVEHPGSIYCRDGKFDINNDREKFWFNMISPYCENGFYTDLTPSESDAKMNIWGISLEKVRAYREARGPMRITPIFRYVDVNLERRKKMQAVKEKDKAIDYVKGLSDKDSRELYAALGQPNYEDEEVETIRLFLRDLAESDPKVRRADGLTRESLMKNDGKNVSYTATVVKAEALGVILYRKNQRTWSFDLEKKEVICLVVQGRNPTEYLVEWLRTKDDNGQVYEAIKAGVKSKEVVTV